MGASAKLEPTPARSRAASLPGRRLLTRLVAGDLRGYAIVVVMFLVAGWINSAMFEASTLQALAARAVPIMLVATGEACVLLLGELDLSVGAITALAGVLVISLMNGGMPTGEAVAVAVAAGAAAGFVNGWCTAVLRVSSFIVTLGSSFAFYGVALAAAKGVQVPASEFGPTTWLAESFGSIFTPVTVIGIVVIAAVAIGVGSTPWGRQLYAIGGDPESAERWGLRVRRRVIEAFMLSGALAAAGGVLTALLLATGDPTVGSDVLLDAIAGAVIGGVGAKPGEGRIGSAACGALALIVLEFLLNQQNVGASTQQLVAGLVVVLVGLGRLEPALTRSLTNNLPRPLMEIWQRRTALTEGRR